MQHYLPQRDTAVQEVKQEAELWLSSLWMCPRGLLSFLKEHGSNSKVNALPKSVPLIIHSLFPLCFLAWIRVSLCHFEYLKFTSVLSLGMNYGTQVISHPPILNSP